MAHDAIHDLDPDETAEWIDALEAVYDCDGPERTRYLMDRLQEAARNRRLSLLSRPVSAYQNTIPVSAQGPYPGDLAIEEKLTAIMRWNALAMVIRGNRAYGGLGGHIASYASAAEIFETGFNHFFHAHDLVFFQPHSAPGVYSRAFLEGRLTEAELDRFRQEVGGGGLCSYPHPWLRPDFWQFPTGSMGLGPISAIYQARFMRYLEARGLSRTRERRVWGVFGDGEMDEPESVAGLTLAARERLDNLTFVVNCNLQRLDGPVRGNGQVIQELESLFLGAGWNVIKVLWGSEWDDIFSADRNRVLLRRFAETTDGEYQNLGSKDGDYNRAKFFNADPESASLVAHLSDDAIHRLKRGGHDLRKLHAAFAAASAHEGQPTVILAKTKKGYGMGGAGESRMAAHQAKTLNEEALRAFRDRFDLPLDDAALAELRYLKPAPDSAEMRYLAERRAALGGPLPERRAAVPGAERPTIPELESYARFALRADGKAMSTTVAAVRMLNGMLKDRSLGPRIVPIVADEARTFGMDNLFRQVGIYSPDGQLYEPEDAGSMLYYREKADGQLLEEGITEAGAMASWTAAATAYSVHGQTMLPVFIFYSMFGFQRVGDLIWAAADQRARGFLWGATAGRTTLSGEGLQHQDGSSQLVATTIPTCRAYDPAYAYELAVILDHGTRRMIAEQRDEFYYLTMMNESYAQPSMPEGAREGIIAGGYRLEVHGPGEPGVRLLGSGAILPQVIEGARLLAQEGVGSEVISVTSYSELERGARAAERARRLGGRASCALDALLPGDAPVIAATDYVRAVPSLIAPHLSAPMTVLGTDGFGRSATREDLRRFFEVDGPSVALAALAALERRGTAPEGALERMRERVGAAADGPAPWTL